MREDYNKVELLLVLDHFIEEMRDFISKTMRQHYGDRWANKFCDFLETDQKKIWKSNIRSGYAPKSFIDYQHLRPFAANCGKILSQYFGKKSYNLPTWFDEIYLFRNHATHFTLENLKEDDLTKAIIHMCSIAETLEMDELKIKLKEIRNKKEYDNVKSEEKESIKSTISTKHIETEVNSHNLNLETSISLELERLAQSKPLSLEPNIFLGHYEFEIPKPSEELINSLKLKKAVNAKKSEISTPEINENQEPISFKIFELLESDPLFQQMLSVQFIKGCPQDILESIAQKIHDGYKLTDAEKLIYNNTKNQNIKKLIDNLHEKIEETALEAIDRKIEENGKKHLAIKKRLALIEAAKKEIERRKQKK